MDENKQENTQGNVPEQEPDTTEEVQQDIEPNDKAETEKAKTGNDIEAQNEALEKKLNTKKKLSVKKKLIIVVASVLAVVLLLVGGAALAIDMYLEYMTDLISYDDGSNEWSGVNIDDPSYDLDESLTSDTPSYVDPEQSDFPDVSNPSDTSDTSDPSNTSDPFGTPAISPIDKEYEDNVINILLIGADKRSGKSSRSDTMILLSINTVKERIVFTSLMRDTYVSIPGYKDNRLNAAYAAGGPSLLMKTVEHNFKLDVDYYATVDFESFQAAIDALNGIDLTVNNDNYDYFKTWFSGLSQNELLDGTHTVHLNGSQALDYARNRNYSSGDFIRTLHQRDLLTQFVKNLVGSSLGQIQDMLETVLPYVTTDISQSTLKDLIWDSLTFLTYDIDDTRVPVSGGYEYANMNGREVILIDLEKNVKYIQTKIYG